MTQGFQDNPESATATATQPQTQLLVAAVPSPVRAAWVASANTLEGLGRVLNPLAVGLVDELVKLYAVVPESASLGELPSPPVEVLGYRKGGLLGISSSQVEDLAEQLRRQKVQLLHALEPVAWPLCRQLAKLVDCPCVVSVWALGDTERLGRLPAPTRVVATSEPIRRQLQDQGVAPAERVELIRPGIFQARQPSCFVDPTCSSSIVVNGPLEPAGPFETVLRSLAQLQSRQFECVYFVIGEGKAQKRLRALAERLSLRHELTFVDRQPARHLGGILKAADIYVMPAPQRHLPLDALAAQAAGVPVLFNAADAGDFLIHGRTAMRFDPTNVGELTELLARLVGEPDTARALAQRALDHLKAFHGVGRSVAAMANLYRNVIGGKSVPTRP